MSDRPATPEHVPVLLERVVALLGPALTEPGAVLLDATVGLGGHARALLEAHPEMRLLGLDRDPQALAIARTRLAAYADRVVLVQAVYDALPDVVAQQSSAQVDAVLFDLGVSSLQLDTAERGFAYSYDAPLDMRMGPDTPRTAADIVNTYSADALAQVLYSYGEERFARRIAAAVVRERTRAPLTSTGRLAELVRAAVPAAARRTGGHPAKRTFQALRIEVNDELGALQRALPAAITAVRTGGRIVVLSYHSLEDRIVKRVFAAGARPRAPEDLPVIPALDRPTLRLLTRGAEVAGESEAQENPRASSVRLRAVERLAAAA